jgi:UPF0716 protein FxsA
MGIGLLQRIRTETGSGTRPDREVVHGAMLVLAAILLIVPGFVSSAVGILLFIPFIRDFMWEKFMRGRMVVATSTRYSTGYGHQSSGRDPRQDHIIDLDPEDYTARPDENPPSKHPGKDH